MDPMQQSMEQGESFGFGDELNAGVRAIAQPLTGGGSDADSIGQRYAENLATERARLAAIPAAVAIPGQLIGGGVTIAAGAPLAAGRAVAAGARLLPGGEAAANALSGAGSTVANALRGIPGISYLAPVAKVAADGAGYGGIQGFGDGEGSVGNRLESAAVGAGPCAVGGPGVQA